MSKGQPLSIEDLDKLTGLGLLGDVARAEWDGCQLGVMQTLDPVKPMTLVYGAGNGLFISMWLRGDEPSREELTSCLQGLGGLVGVEARVVDQCLDQVFFVEAEISQEAS